MQEVIEQLRQALPPIFLGSASDELTGGAVCWATTQNKRCKGEIPDNCFVRSGPRILVIRDRFLDWWASPLQPARATTDRHRPPVPHAGRRQRATEAA
jgi:hypothetical protein